MNLEQKIEKELGKQNAPGSAHEDWAEIEQDIENGLTREQAIEKYLKELEEIRIKQDKEEKERKEQFLQSEEYQISQLTPEQYKQTKGREKYNELVIKWQAIGGKRKKVRDFDSFMDLTGYGGHDMVCFNAYVLFDIPIPNESIVKYKLERYKTNV